MDNVGAKSNRTAIVALIVLVVVGAVSLGLSAVAQSPSWRFLLAFYPLIMILFGVALLGQNALCMALVGLALTLVLAVFKFHAIL